MHLTEQKQQFSLAYLQAVSAVAGFAMEGVRVDNDSVDVTLYARGVFEGVVSPRLDIQAKCTAVHRPSGGVINFPLKLKNYEDLRATNVHVPKFLVVLEVPGDDPEAWLQHSPMELALRRCGFWCSLMGFPGTTNTKQVTVPIPEGQILSPSALRGLMSQAARWVRGAVV